MILKIASSTISDVVISTRSWGVYWLVTNDYGGSGAVFYETPLPWLYLWTAPYVGPVLSGLEWIYLCSFQASIVATEWQEMNKTSKCSAQWRSGSAFWKKGWLQYMAPVVVVDIDCPRTTIYRSLSPQTPPSLIPFFHHYFTKVFPPIAKRCTVMFSWWNIIWSTNWRVFTLPEILRLASFFLFRI